MEKSENYTKNKLSFPYDIAGDENPIFGNNGSDQEMSNPIRNWALFLNQFPYDHEKRVRL